MRHNVDPFLSTFAPLRDGKHVAVTTASTTLLPAVPHLYKLAQYPVAVHVSLYPPDHPDFSEITAIRQSGFAFLQSETIQEAQDMALTAHALAMKSGKGVIHFFDPKNSARDDPIAAEDPGVVRSVLGGVASKGAAPDEEQLGFIYVDDGHQASLAHLDLPAGPGGEPPKSDSKSGRSSLLASNAGSQETSSMDSTTPRESSAGSRPSSSATSVESVIKRPVSSEDVLDILHDIWGKLEAASGRAYRPFEYTGPEDAEHALFVFGSTGLFVDELSATDLSGELGRVGLLTARLYRPWLSVLFAEALPETVKRIAVLEQVRRKTTKWGPVLLDVLTSLRAGPSVGAPPLVVGHHLGHLEPATIRQAVRGILHNLRSPSPIQNLDIGNTKPVPPLESKDYQPEQPPVENAYFKILRQVFGKRLFLANRIEASNVGISSSLAASPEFGFGALLARLESRKRFVARISSLAQSNDFITDAPRKWLSKWSLSADEPSKAEELAEEVVQRLSTDGSRLASDLLDQRAFFSKESQWLIGSDAWAYDLGNSGVHHVLASGANLNMLIIDSQPYSERASADATRRKKDIGLYAMNFGNAYVASVAVYGSYTQVLEAMIEADKFDGPSIVLAYLPYNKENDSPLTVLQETKKAVDLGYWPLYRWNPGNEEQGEPNFNLDSERIKQELEDFLRRDNQLSQMMNRRPNFAATLSGSYGTEVRALQKRRAKEAYEQMLEGLYGAPLTIVFASDNGNAEGLAKRLAIRGKARGLKTMVMAMDEYPIEDLASEENVVMITSTAGQGEFPQNGRAFWDAVKDAGDLDLSTVKYSVVALGDSHYWPRKEDKVYYNKPGKDLDNRIAFLGAKRLTDIGLGNDQDPDGYQTGYNEWEPRLWQALDVANVEGLPEEPPPITNEDIKVESNYLRGTIAEGLEDTSTGAISASDQQLTKFHGTYMQDDRDLRDDRKAQGLEPAYSFMIRCRLNGGVASPAQWLKMDAISSEHGNKTMKLTTRQTFQFHGVIKTKLKPAMRAINRALMTTIAACGDVNRNVMVSTLPSQSALHKDVHTASAKIASHLLPSTSAYHEIWIKDPEKDGKTQVGGNAVVDHEPLYGATYLPRKFKITIAVPPRNDTDVYAHDIGLIAIKDPETGRLAGFNVLAGGGMGVTHGNKKTYPRTGSLLGFSPSDQVHLVCEKIMLVQRDNGDRKNRKHARLKYTIDDMGVDVFRSKVEELLGRPLEPARKFPAFTHNTDVFGWQKDEGGLHHFTMFIENGRVEDSDQHRFKTGLGEVAGAMLEMRKQQGGSEYGEAEEEAPQPEFRLTPNQPLCVSTLPDAQRTRIAELLAEYGLDNTAHSALRLSSSACVAFPTCGLAMAESERYLPQLVSLLEPVLADLGLAREELVLRMTGCPNGCARPWLAEVALVGKAYGAYNLYLGGGFHGQRLNKLYRGSIGEEEILEILTPLLKRWRDERTEGEHFGDFCIRAGVIKETTEGKAFHEDVAEDESDEE